MIWPLWLLPDMLFSDVAMGPRSAVISVIQAADAGRTDQATHLTSTS